MTSAGGGYTTTALAIAPGGQTILAGYGMGIQHPITAGALDLLPTSSISTAEQEQFNDRLPATGFVTQLSANGSSIAHSTYFGGTNGSTFVNAVTTDASGNAYITGQTYAADLPVANALQPQLGGTNNVFVAKLNPTGTGLIYATYLGGGLNNGYWANCSSFGSQAGNAISIDSSGNAYVGGHFVLSHFPILRGGDYLSYAASSAFLTKLNPSGSALIYSTSYAGSNDSRDCYEIKNPQSIRHLIVDDQGNVYAAGSKSSVLRYSSFPLVKPLLTYGSGFVLQLDPTGNAVIFSSLLPQAPEYSLGPLAPALGLDGQNNLYIAMNAGSHELSGSSGIQSDYQGAPNPSNFEAQGGDNLVYKLLNVPTVSLTSSAPIAVIGQAVTLTATISRTANAGSVSFQDGAILLGTVNVSVGGGVANYAVPSFTQIGIHSIRAIYTDTTITWGVASPSLTQVVNQPAICD